MQLTMNSLSPEIVPATTPAGKPKRVACLTLRVVREGSIELPTLATEYGPSVIRAPRDAADMFRAYIGDAYREHFVLLALDTKGKPIGLNTVSIGDLASSLVNPREVFRTAIAMGAASILVAHNHPSGDPSGTEIVIDPAARVIKPGDAVLAHVSGLRRQRPHSGVYFLNADGDR